MFPSAAPRGLRALPAYERIKLTRYGKALRQSISPATWRQSQRRKGGLLLRRDSPCGYRGSTSFAPRLRVAPSGPWRAGYCRGNTPWPAVEPCRTPVRPQEGAGSGRITDRRRDNRLLPPAVVREPLLDATIKYAAAYFIVAPLVGALVWAGATGTSPTRGILKAAQSDPPGKNWRIHDFSRPGLSPKCELLPPGEVQKKSGSG